MCSTWGRKQQKSQILHQATAPEDTLQGSARLIAGTKGIDNKVHGKQETNHSAIPR